MSSSRSRIALVVAALAALLPAPALALPPATGTDAPRKEQPTRVTFGYVGFAYIGPVFGCFEQVGADGQTLISCVDPARPVTHVRTYTRLNDHAAWQPRSTVSGQLVFTAPYGRGWQWIWSQQTGTMVIPARSLVTATFLT
jgi:hypothetical protein